MAKATPKPPVRRAPPAPVVIETPQPAPEPPETEDEVLSLAELPEDVQLAQLLADLDPTDVKVRVYRAEDMELLAVLPVDGFDPILLAGEPYNGGKFRIHVRGRDGKLVTNRVIKVARSARHDIAPAAAAAPPSAVTPEQLATIVAQAVTNAMAAARPGSPLESLEGIERVAKMFKNENATPQRPVSVLDSLKELAALDTFLERRAPRAPTVVDDRGRVDIWGSVINRVVDAMATQLPKMGPRAESAPAPGAAAALPPPAAGAVVEEGAAAAASEQRQQEQPQRTEQEISELRVVIKYALDQACAAASQNYEPAAFADDVYDNIPEDLFFQMARDPNWFAGLCAINPKCQPHEAWFTKVRDKLVEIGRAEGALAPLDAPQGAGQNSGTTTTGAADGAAVRPSGGTGNPA